MRLEREIAMGALFREEAEKLYRRKMSWEIFSKTLGWYQHTKTKKYTHEQLAAIEDGYRNYSATKKAKLP